MGHSRGRPVPAGAGMNGTTTAHSLSVRQVAYGMSSRATCAWVAGDHRGGLSESSNTSGTHKRIRRLPHHALLTPPPG